MELEQILIMAAICGTLALLIVGLTHLLGLKQPDAEKVSIYECGFEPFRNTGEPFPIKFFLVGILFTIFDLEVIYLLP